MLQTVVPSQYLQIAQDLAARIAGGELAEGSRIYGRSVMASEYNVSPETIRRALRLLADRKIVETRPQSGTIVLSSDNARRYLQNFEDGATTEKLRAQLRELAGQYAELNRQVVEVAAALIRSEETFQSAAAPLPNFEVPVPEGSPMIGKSIGTLRFWQATGGTIVAIRRGQTVIVSPGPYAELYGGDVVVLVGGHKAAQAAARLLEG